MKFYLHRLMNNLYTLAFKIRLRFQVDQWQSVLSPNNVTHCQCSLRANPRPCSSAKQKPQISFCSFRCGERGKGGHLSILEKPSCQIFLHNSVIVLATEFLTVVINGMNIKRLIQTAMLIITGGKCQFTEALEGQSYSFLILL